MKKFFAFFLLLPLLLVLAGCGEAPEEEQITEEDVMDLVGEAESVDWKVRGSCNAIAQASTCVDYVGSLWTEEQMKLNCQGAGNFSLDACPYSEIGGCNTGLETIAEVVLWSYQYGGAPVEEPQYAAGACNNLPMAKWVLPDELLERKNK
ncbi:MAG TPA: hypothetical protein VJB37_02535 [Patescibacteria group bacterium]|nr:hypothetical protein [Patescibacteria group bacterium]